MSLLPPDFELHDENDDPWYPSLTKSQTLLWTIYQETQAIVRKIAKGDPIYVYHLGDVTHGNHYPDKELVSSMMAHQVLIGIGNLAQWVIYPEVKGMFLVKGTGVHEFGRGSSTTLVANHLQEMAECPVHVVQHGLMKVGNLKLDLSHHGPSGGIREWTKGNVLRLYTRSLMLRELDRGRQPADIMARGHYHTYVPETVTIRRNGRTHRTHALILPSFSFMDSYARKVTQSRETVTVGMVLVEVVDYRVVAIYDKEPEFMQTFDLRKEVVVYDG